MSPRFLAILVVLSVAAVAAAQDNYEIQVFGADTVKPGHTMFELPSTSTWARRGSSTQA